MMPENKIIRLSTTTMGSRKDDRPPDGSEVSMLE